MVPIIPSWTRHRRKSARRRRRNAVNLDGRSRRPLFEELEDRRLLAVNFVNVGNSLDSQLLAMQTRLTSGLNDYKSGATSTLPMVGSSLGTASQIVNRFNTDVKSALASLGASFTVTDQSISQIQDALSSLPFLVDRNGNGVGADDVLVTRPGNMGTEGFAVEMRLAGALLAASGTFRFDTGLPALPFKVTTGGTINVSVGYAYELAFTYNSTNQQVALDTTKTLSGGPAVIAPSGNHPLAELNHPLAIFVSATFPQGFSASTTVGFVPGTLTARDGEPNALNLTVMVDSLVTGPPSLKLDGAANLNLKHVGPNTNNDFPAIDIDEIHVHWAFESAHPDANRPEIKYDKVFLNLGNFLSTVVGPILESIQTTTKPLEPVQDIIGKPLPGVSDLSRAVGGKDISLIDVAGVLAHVTNYGPLFDLIRSVANLIESINAIDIGDTVRIPLGGFDLNNLDLRTIAAAGDVSDLSRLNLTNLSIDNVQELNFDDVVNNLNVPDDAKALVRKLVAGLNNGYKIEFPILKDPKNAVFGLLLGKDADLFTFTADYDFTSQGSALPSFEVIGIGVTFENEVHANTHFKFAYDTYGLREMINHAAASDTSHVASDIIDGFYIADNSHFTLDGGLSAAVSARYGVFSAKVGGFVSTDDSGNEPVSITIEDPNHDGKLRFLEFQSNPFHTSGRFVGELGIEVKVGVTILGKFIGFKKRFAIATVVLVDFNTPGSSDPNPLLPILASQPDNTGVIQLYVGASANLRQNVFPTNGNDKIIIRNIATTAQSETVEIALLQKVTDPITHQEIEFYVTQEIAGVKKIVGYGDQGILTIDVLPGVNVDVEFHGSEGKTELLYNGAGSAYLQAGQGDAYLLGGQGSNSLLGGPGNDTLILGGGSNLVSGSAGDNTFVMVTPMTQGGVVFGGSDEGHNTFAVVAGEGTDWISAMPGVNNSIDLNYQIAGAPAAPGLGLRQFSTFVVSAQDRSTDITIGDLSPAGVSEVIVNIPTTGDGGRNVTLDTRAGGGTSQITIDPFLHVYDNPDFDSQLPPGPENPLVIENDELKVFNITTGVATYLLGMKDADLTTIRQHGGSAQIGQLSKDEGSLSFDFSTRPAGVVQTVTMTTPALAAGNVISSHVNAANDFVLDAINYPTLIFHGLRSVDSITANVAAPTQASGINSIVLDASSLVGTLNVNALGGSSAQDAVTVSKLTSAGNIAVHGGSTSTTAFFGTGQLADIRGDVSIDNAVLTIDNHLAQGANPNAPGNSILVMTESTFSGWVIPSYIGPAPELSYSGLNGTLTVGAGASDRFTLDGTPSSIASAVFNNGTASRNAVYLAAWTKPLTLNGDFVMYLGERLTSGATVQRIEHLTGLANVPITLNFSTVIGSGTDIVFDGELDPAGASYTIDGIGNLHIVNQSVGLNVTINGYRDQDGIHLRLPGGSVNANLVQTGRGTIYVDGTARAGGINPTASNNITAALRAGTHTLDPAASTDSVLHAFDTLYVVGTLVQDDLTLNVPTFTAAATLLTADASQLVGTLHINALDAGAGMLTPLGLTTITLAAVNPLLAVFVLGSNPYPGSASYQVAQTTFAFGAGQLSRIKGNVTASKVVLHIDDSATARPSDLMLTDTTFDNWIIPGSSLTPALTYSNLYKTLAVDAGPGDRFGLDQTPAGIDGIVLNNSTTTLDPLYTADWTVPIAFNGNFSFYAGQRLVPGDLSQEQNATIERVKRLEDVAVPVTMNFSGVAASEVVLDGDLDSAGAAYSLDGTGNLHVVNQTVGLSVTIIGYRDQDKLYVYMPGASVAANLQRTSRGTVYLDGTARLAGTNPAAANNITIAARYGETEMVPLGAYNSRLDMFNDVYLLGSMPQDSLAVTAPTHVRITASKPNLLDLNSIPGIFASVPAARPDAFIAWKERPAGPYFTPFNNVDALTWDNSYGGVSYYPNPFLEMAYGIDIPHTDGPLSVEYNVYESHQVLSGIGRFYLVDPHPVAVDNDVRLDASQLRGSFQFNVIGPDYDYIANLVRNSFHQFPTEYTFNYFHTWYSEYDYMRIAFGQNNVVLSHVNPQLSVEIISENKDYAYPAGTFPSNSGPEKQVVVSSYPVTSLNVGDGVLANIQGNLSTREVALTLDDSAGTTANNIILTGTTIGNWATAAGITHPVLTMAALENRPLTLIGNSLDRFGVENTPTTAGPTTVRNLATSGTHTAVFVMAKTPTRALDVVGNFDLYIGRRLNADGTVTNVGQVAGVLPGAFQSNPQPITFDFRGTGNGLLLYDASTRIATESGNMGQMVITSDTTDLTKGRLLFEHLNNAVIYGANSDLDLYGPTIAAQAFNPNTPRVSLLVDHRLPGTVHYFAGPTVPSHIVRVMAAFGPVFIQGRGALTRVEVDPADVTINAFNTFNNPAFVSPGNDLRDTILADVTVTNVALIVRPDLATTPAPAQLKNIVIANSQVTGIAGAAIHFADLRDIDNIAYITPGLLVQLPRHGANLTIADTPAGVTTGIHAIGSPLANVHVLGTTGKLALGSLGQYYLESNVYAVDGFQPVNFAAQSLTIGDGSVQNIHGEVLLGRAGTFTTTAGTVIDNRSDPSPRDATFYISPTNGYPLIEGLAPAAIRMRQLSGGLAIYDSPGSHFTARNLDNIAQAVTLYGGVGSTVDLVAPGTGYGDYDVIPAMRVLGAGTVRLLVPALEGQVRYLRVPTSSVVRIGADPARPNDVTHLSAEFSEVNLVYIGNDYITNFVELLEIAGDGTGRLSLGNPTFATQVEFAAATTEFTLFGSKYGYYPQEIRVADSGPGGTVIYPGRQKVNVLGTTGPVEIHQPTPPLFGSTPFSVVVGNAGNMQAIHGDVTVIGDNPALPVAPLTLNDSADGVARTATVSYPSSNHWDIAGMAPATIHVLGAYVDIALLAGTGNNSLAGPNFDNLWEINATNGGKLNSRLTYGGVANLVGGALDDDFFIKQAGLVGGNLDGGPGYDVIHFDSNVLSGGETINLSAGIVPRINGTVTNVEAVAIDILPVNDQTSTVGATIVPFQIIAWGGIAPLTFSAVGLPANLVIDVHTGYISGTISNGADASSPYNVAVSASDGAYTGVVAFRWNVLPIDVSTVEAISLSDPSLGPLPNNASYLEPGSTVASADGRYVAFPSGATNLVPGDTNNKYDVFVRDRQTGTTTLVSRGISAPGNGYAYDPSISGDGRYVAFYSNSTNLVPGGTNGNYQVFVRDMQTGTTSLVSMGLNGQGNNTSSSPAISANGRYIAFSSGANNLVPGVGDGSYQIYVRDLQAGTTALVSTGPNGVGNSQSFFAPAMSFDGRYIAFASYSTNLVPGGTNGKLQVFVRDLQAGSTTLASTGIGGQANQHCYDVSISADGRHVGFDSSATNLVAQPTNSKNCVYVSDWQTGAITLVSVDSAGQVGNSDSYGPTISATGRYVAFDSYASNLAAGDTNGRDDVFLRDLQTGITKRISVGSAGQGDRDSFYPSISADGRAVVFESYADNLVPGFNVQNYGDIYLYFNPLAVADGIFIPGDFNHDNAVDAADYVWLRKNASNQSAYDTWRANFGSTAATSSQALSAGFSIADSPLVSVVQANVPEVGADGGAETLDNRREMLIAHDLAWTAVAPARLNGGIRSALFHASQRRADDRYTALDTALLARQLAFAALTDGENDHADPFVFGKSDEIDEPEMFHKSFDGLFNPSINSAELQQEIESGLQIV